MSRPQTYYPKTTFSFLLSLSLSLSIPPPLHPCIPLAPLLCSKVPNIGKIAPFMSLKVEDPQDMRTSRECCPACSAESEHFCVQNSFCSAPFLALELSLGQVFCGALALQLPQRLWSCHLWTQPARNHSLRLTPCKQGQQQTPEKCSRETPRREITPGRSQKLLAELE